MITRFDHTVIAVRDLDEAMQRYKALGFDVSAGGRHTGLGTHNALIRFGLDYIELLSVYNEAEAAAGGLARSALVDFLREHESGLVGYALAISDMQQEAARFRSGPTATEPFAMQRMRPDGHLLSWHLLVPGNVAWRRPWPFLIHWDIPDEQRLAWEKPGTHPNGAIRWAEIAVAVRDLESAVELYQRQLELPMSARDEAPHLAARRATFHVGSSRIDLLAPTAKGPVQQMLDEVGEGTFELTLAVRNLAETRAYLTQAGIRAEAYPADSRKLLLAPHQTPGARLVLMGPENQ